MSTLLLLALVAVALLAFSQGGIAGDLPPGDPLTPPPEDPSVPGPVPPDPSQGVPDLPTQDPTPPIGDPVPPSPDAWLPGDNHDYDNQFLYAPGSDQNLLGKFNGDPRVPLALKAIAWKEAGESWSWNPLAHNLSAIEDSRGIMQVNVRAHPQFATWDLYDPNVCILAASYVFAGTWNPGNLFGSVAAYNGSGPMAQLYAARVLTVLEPMAAEFGVSLG